MLPARANGNIVKWRRSPNNRFMASCGKPDPWAAYRSFGKNVATVAAGTFIGYYFATCFTAFLKERACNSLQAEYEACLTDNKNKPKLCDESKKSLAECKEKNK